MKNEKGYGSAATHFLSETHKECSNCLEVKLHSEFHRNANNPSTNNLAYYCKECANSKGRVFHHSHKTKSEYKDKRLCTRTRRTYNLTAVEYKQKLVDQSSICVICSIPLQTGTSLTHLDHDHKTGKLRDFLCTNCNRGLGHFKDNPLVLEEAAKYLRRHNVDVDNIKEDN